MEGGKTARSDSDLKAIRARRGTSKETLDEACKALAWLGTPSVMRFIIDLNWTYFRGRSCASCVKCGCLSSHRQAGSYREWGRKMLWSQLQQHYALLLRRGLHAVVVLTFFFFFGPRGGRSHQRGPLEITHPEKPSDMGQPPKPIGHSFLSMVSHFPRVGKGILASVVPIQVFRIHMSYANWGTERLWTLPKVIQLIHCEAWIWIQSGFRIYAYNTSLHSLGQCINWLS